MNERVLHYEKLTAGSGAPSPGMPPERWLLTLHGAFGSGRNWAGVIKRLVQRRKEWGGVLVDLREHGRSAGLSGPHTLAAAAGDLDGVAREVGGAAAVLGHSFGGKVAMQWVRQGGWSGGGSPNEKRQVWVVDSTPERVQEGPEGDLSGDAWAMLRLLRELPGEFESRAAAVGALQAEGISFAVASWMAMNLDRVDGNMRWRFDLDALESLLRDFYTTELWDVVEDPPAGVELHFIKASDSDVISEAALERIQSATENGRVRLHHIEGGHWLNIDNPDALVELLSGHL